MLNQQEKERKYKRKVVKEIKEDDGSIFFFNFSI